jgi:adenylate cyclase
VSQRGARTRAFPLGHYLGCPEGALQAILELQDSEAAAGSPSRIGERLVEAGMVSSEQLEAAVCAQRIDRLRCCPVFSDLEEEDLRALSLVFEEVSFPAGRELLAQDSDVPHLYVLAAGRLEVLRIDGEGSETVLCNLGPGEPVGEIGLASGGGHSATVRAVERSHLLRATYERVSESLELSPRIARAFWSVVSERLRDANLRYQRDHARHQVAARSLRHLQEFLDLSETSALGLGIEGLIERLVHTAGTLMDAERASLFLLDRTTGELWSKVAEGAEVKEIRVPGGAGIVGWVVAHRSVLNIPDAYDDERFNQDVDRKTGYRTRSILCGPVWGLNGDVLGVIQVINKRTQAPFDAEDEHLFQAFAHQAAVAVENFYLYERMVASHNRMAVLLDVARSFSETIELASLINRIVTKVPEALHCERSSFFMFDAARNELWSMVAQGDDVQEIRFSADLGLAGDCARTGRVVNVRDAYSDPRFNPEVDRRSGYRTRSVLSVAVRHRDGRVIGVVEVINKSGGPFEDADVELLEAIAAQIAVAVDNATLHADVLSMKNYLERVQETISNVIVTLDVERRVVTINDAGCELIGDSAEHIVGRAVDELFSSEDGFLPSAVARVIGTGRRATELDLPLRGLVDGDATVNANVLPLESNDGEIQGAVLVLEDITRERRIRNALNRYMASDIVDRVLEDPTHAALGGVRGRASMLFCDIRDFTSIAESLSAEQVMEFLNEYFTLMVEEVYQQRGVLDKFMGDAVMAVFGVPYPQDDDATRAVRAALGMRRTLDVFNRGRASAGLSALRVGIGIHTDDVVSGNIGSLRRMDYTVIGDGVNLASRIEALNKIYGTTILVSEATRLRLADEFTLRTVDKVVAQGHSRPVEIYEVLGDRRTSPNRAQRSFSRGLEHYQVGRFEDALQIFSRGAAEDGVCATFARRCESLLRDPEAARDWDGVWRVDRK